MPYAKHRSRKRVRVRQRGKQSLFVAIVLASIAGCSTATSHLFFVVTVHCDCEEYRYTDPKQGIEVQFRARYMMLEGITTTVDIRFANNSADTLHLDLASAMVSSRNIRYQYNNKFVPLPDLHIPQNSTDDVHLFGRSLDREDNWNVIAGEQMTITLQGLRLGDRMLDTIAVEFIPQNPKLEQ